MKKLTLIFTSILLAHASLAEEPMLELEFDDPFVDLDTPPVLQEPVRKKAPKLVQPESADTYCLCKCILKGHSAAKAKFFSGKKSGRGCICECAVK
mgnify:CR=1 FL=1